MSATPTNTQVVLARRPPGVPTVDDFEIAESPIPRPVAGEVFVRTIYVSVDPYMRGRLWEQPLRGEPIALGQVMIGAGVGEVVFSSDPRLREGEIVRGEFGWQKYAVTNLDALEIIDRQAAPLSTALGVLGMPGLTAYYGMLEVARPRAGDTAVVTAAAGAVGSAAGQIAKLQGCRVVGICGSDEKCMYLVNELGFDAAINYRSQPLDAALESACPDGIDVIFDNVGGEVLEALLRRINLHARIALCGAISQYHSTELTPVPPHSRTLHSRRARMEGFLVNDFADRDAAAMAALSEWVAAGQLTYRENIVAGIENAPAAFVGLFTGTNIGKQLVRVSPEDVSVVDPS